MPSNPNTSNTRIAPGQSFGDRLRAALNNPTPSQLDSRFAATIIPSAAQSETSTLVNVPLDDHIREEDESDDELETSDENMLGRDNSSWTKPKKRTPKKKTSTGPTTAAGSSSASSQAQMANTATGRSAAHRAAAEHPNSRRLFASK